jgi:crotonobetainyl-CoA:carnitine CoA-transferase CaiB-like acyl-CoA transferase
MQILMAYLFEDLTVIDAASFVAGPGAATIFADFGAQVIKVEAPAGDAYRLLHGRYRTDYNWALTSRNKRDIAIDLYKEEGRAIMHRLVDSADVLILNFREDQLQQFELTVDELKKRNPRLVIAQLTAFGTQGPDGERRGYDTTAWWARTGITDLLKPHQQAPTVPLGGVGDHASAMTLFAGIMMALYQRDRTGLGDYVETSLVANGCWSNGMHLQGAIAGFDLSEKLDEKGYRSPFSMIYQTKENRFLVLVIPNPEKDWPGLARCLGHPEWIEDERFTTLRSLMHHRDKVKEMIASAFLTMTVAQACRALDTENLTYSIVEKLADVIKDAQLVENGVIVETGSDDPDFKWTVANPIQMQGAAKVPPQDPPVIGQDTVNILRDIGYSNAAISAFAENGSIVTAQLTEESSE